MGSARPSVTKKQREQKKRERQAMKAERRAQRKIESHNPQDPMAVAEPEEIIAEDLPTPS